MKKIICFICILLLLQTESNVAYAVKKDDEPPTVIKTDPVSNATEIEVGHTIVIHFNEAVKSSKMISKIRMSGPNKSYVKFTVAISDNLLFIKPDRDLERNKKYTLSIPAAAVCDTSGNDLKYICQYSFVTEEPKQEDKDVFKWQESDFVNLPKPEAILNSIVKDENTQSVMSTFSKLREEAAASYVYSLKNIGYTGDCDYNDNTGIIFTAENSSGQTIVFIYSSITQAGTLLYRYGEQESDNNTSEELSEDTGSTDNNSANESADTSDDSFSFPSITISQDFLKIPQGSEAIVVVAIQGEGTIRIKEGETPRVFFPLDHYEYIDDMSVDNQDFELICINEDPTKIKVSYLSNTDNTVSYLVEALQGYKTVSFSFLLESLTLGDASRTGCSVQINR